jgi:8-oxo-dGTP pyrophosphatase MutT (NUDIX family)
LGEPNSADVELASARALEAHLASHPRVEFPALPGRRNHLRAGVLVPLVWRPDPVCVLTVRAGGLKHHAGEVCFPGGRPDAADRDLEHTALREAREELGIERARVLGVLSSIPLYTSDFRLDPYVAEIAPQPLVPSADEVAEVLEVPVASWLTRSTIDAIAWEAGELHGLSPVFALGEHRMYGATAHSFYELLCVIAAASGRVPPPLVACDLRWSDVLPREST